MLLMRSPGRRDQPASSIDHFPDLRLQRGNAWPLPCSGHGYADLRTALSTSVLPSDQIAPGTLWLAAMTESNAVSIHLPSPSVMVSGGSNLMVWLPWPETC